MEVVKLEDETEPLVSSNINSETTEDEVVRAAEVESHNWLLYAFVVLLPVVVFISSFLGLVSVFILAYDILTILFLLIFNFSEPKVLFPSLFLFFFFSFFPL